MSMMTVSLNEEIKQNDYYCEFVPQEDSKSCHINNYLCPVFALLLTLMLELKQRRSNTLN